jgi:diguanylate cyclase (GGDEF)-like protein
MTRKFRSQASEGRSSGYRVLLVDDQEEYLEANRMILESQGHTVLTAENGPEALRILRISPVDLVLLDFFMPGMTGEQVVEELRKFNTLVQVVLQTGYASERPARELLKRLDIQGYHDKSDGPEKLLLWTDIGLKAAAQLASIHHNRMVLQRILQATPELHRIQPLADLLNCVLNQLCRLIEAEDSYVSMLPGWGAADERRPPLSGFIALMENDTGLFLRVDTDSPTTTRVEPEALPRIATESIESGQILTSEGTTNLPLNLGSTRLGVMQLNREINLERDGELLHIFANQAAVAIQNAQLYEMATLDPLTGANMRRLFEPNLLRELRNALQARSHMSILMLDLDGLKKINDTGGHAAGDAALAAFGRLLRRSLRSGDSVWRFGGDEFAVILPHCNPRTSVAVARRILKATESEIIAVNGQFPLRTSIGAASLDAGVFPLPEFPRNLPIAYYQEMLHMLVQRADEELYRSKKEGGNTVQHAGNVPWRLPG